MRWHRSRYAYIIAFEFQFTKPRLRWFEPTANCSGSKLGREKERPAGSTRSPLPEPDRPDLPTARTPSKHFSITFHRMRLFLPQEIHGSSTRSSKEAIRSHSLSAVAPRQCERQAQENHLQHGVLRPQLRRNLPPHRHQKASQLWPHHDSP